MAMIADVLKYPKGAAVEQLAATIVKAYPQRTGEGQYGPWTVMDLELQDATGTIKAQWWENMVQDPEQVKGHAVVINATPDSKGNLRGAMVDHHEYKGEKSIRIKVSGERLQFAPTNGSANATRSGAPPTAIGTDGKLTLTEYLSIAGRAYRYAVDILGISDPQAAAAIANTCSIAASQGRLRIEPDAEDESTPPF